MFVLAPIIVIEMLLMWATVSVVGTNGVNTLIARLLCGVDGM